MSADIHGPYKVPSLAGAVYVIVFLDSKSDYVYVKSIRRKSDSVEALREFCQQVGKPVELLTDWAKEFTLGK